MISTIIYNGRSFSEFGVFADLSQTLGSPEKDYDFISIPGRNGDLSIFNDKFKDIEFAVHCYIKNDFVQNYRNLIDFLNESHGYLRFETSKEPDYYREALFLGEVDPIVRPFNRNGSFDLAFRCHPQRWLKSSLEMIDVGANYKIFNPTNMPAKPLIRFIGNGELRFVVDEEIIGKITIRNNASPSYVDIDCETYDAYSVDGQGDVVNRNGDVTFDIDPYIPPGECSLPYTIVGQGAYHIYLTPRFFSI